MTTEKPDGREKLLPCPFCGASARADNGFMPIESVTRAWCSNPECYLHDNDIGFEPDTWNKRAPTPPQGHGSDDLCQCPKCGRMHRNLGFGKPPETVAAEALAEEHYQAAMAMSEKHRKLWVEACRERDRLRAAIPPRDGVAGALTREQIARAITTALHSKITEGDGLTAADAILSLSSAPPAQGEWQREVLEWAVDKFGEIARDPRERAMRFIEEAVELAQTQGVTDIDLGRICRRVFTRPAGDVAKEIGQVGMTFEAMAENIGHKVAPLVAAEIERVKTIPKEEWQRRHAAKVAVGAALAASPPVAGKEG